MSSSQESPPSTIVVAVPLAQGCLCLHFGHCEQFALIDADTQRREILNTRQLTPPPHEPGVLPRWLYEQGVKLIIASGMGRRAQMLFAERGIEVVVGAPSEPPEQVVQSYLEGTLQPGQNLSIRLFMVNPLSMFRAVHQLPK